MAQLPCIGLSWPLTNRHRTWEWRCAIDPFTTVKPGCDLDQLRSRSAAGGSVADPTNWSSLAGSRSSARTLRAKVAKVGKHGFFTPLSWIPLSKKWLKWNMLGRTAVPKVKVKASLKCLKCNSPGHGCCHYFSPTLPSGLPSAPSPIFTAVSSAALVMVDDAGLVQIEGVEFALHLIQIEWGAMMPSRGAWNIMEFDLPEWFDTSWLASCSSLLTYELWVKCNCFQHWKLKIYRK